MAPWIHPAGTLSLALAGGDMPQRRAITDTVGNLTLSDGSTRALAPETRYLLQQWATSPAALADAATRQKCDLGADATYLAITIDGYPDLSQPIRLCLSGSASPYKAAVQDIADALRP